MTWNPEQYLKFSDQRLRPALELLARIDLTQPSLIYDVGCGAGNVTEFLSRRWPAAQITGIDSSPDMLANAAQRLPHVTWRQTDIASWRPETQAQLIYSNAALHWLDDHDRLFPRLYRSLAAGGVLAVQMPRNYGQPSHQLLGQSALAGPWRQKLKPLLRRQPVAEPADYWRIFRQAGARIDIWETEYYHPLQGEDAVLAWMSGTTLRPLLAILSDSERTDFLADFGARLRVAYQPDASGVTLFPFRRLFILATSPE